MKSRVKATGRLQKSFDHLYFESRESHLGLSGNRATKSFWWDVTWLFSISDGSGRSSPGFEIIPGIRKTLHWIALVTSPLGMTCPTIGGPDN